MKVTITGAAGFIGSRLAKHLLSPESPIKVTSLTLTDAVLPLKINDSRVTCIVQDLGDSSSADKLVADCDVLFHLAAIVSGHAEADYAYGMKINLESTRNILEASRRIRPKGDLKLVFSSTCGVFGGDLPPVLNDHTATMPQTSYGTAKAMCELLINEYTRRGWIDGRVVRLPTVTVRAGAANRAVTSFASGIVREPLNGEESICPVDKEQKIWITGPKTVIKNIAYAASLSAGILKPWPVVNLPGLSLSVNQMLEALRSVCGDQVAKKVKFEKDDQISSMVASFPINFDNSRALKLGFSVDESFEDIIRSYMKDDLGKVV